MSSADRKICDYHDVLLRQSDLELLADGQWLNDQLIAFYLEYLRQEKFAQAKNELLILDPSAAFMLTAVAPTEVPMVLGSLAAPEKQMVIIPVNDNTDPDKPGGSHWSLLCYFKPSASSQMESGFFHCDSFSNSNLAAAKRLLPAARQLVGDAKATLQSPRVPQQQNCCDCGVFALAFADRMARLCTCAAPSAANQAEAPAATERIENLDLQELVEQSVSTASQTAVSEMRDSIRSLIQDRTRQSLS